MPDGQCPLLVEKQDSSGGSGANFIVERSAEDAVNPSPGRRRDGKRSRRDSAGALR
jgi:hypothetical protein